jgi:hypothetical protein
LAISTVVNLALAGFRPVLRKKGDHYGLLDEAYVYGLMYGEALQHLKEGKVREMNFELQ